jgi:hypothetical protein
MTPIKLFKKIKIILLGSIWECRLSTSSGISITQVIIKQFNFVGLAKMGIELLSEAVVA